MPTSHSPANPNARPYSSEMGKPVMAFCALGAAAGRAGTQGLDIAIGAAPGPGLYMIPAGVWFALVVALAVWKLGHASPSAAAFVILSTFIAWESSVNLALILIDPWLKGGPSDLVYGMVGMAAGAVGAVVTWAGAAWAAVALRRVSTALLTVAAGTLLGALLAATNSFDSPALLFIPWEAVVAASLAFGLVRPPTV